MFGIKHQLQAYLGQEKIALLALMEDDQLRFCYTQNWQDKGYALSPHLPLDNSASENQFNIKVFFQNLFPEGENFDVLLQRFHLSRYNLFGITRTLGQDLPGALQMVMEGQSLPQDSSFRPIEDFELIDRLEHYSAGNLIVWDGKPRLSLAGVHQKINVVLNEKGELGFGEGKLCSTHILKFERNSEQHLVINEFLMMRLAKMIGLHVAELELKFFDRFPTLLVKRFDRTWHENSVQRRHLIDGCQALNLLPEYKYERNLGSGRDVKDIREGASLPQLFRLCEACINPALAKKQLLEWTVFNLIIGNWDAHAKNLSFFLSQEGLELTPAYDLICIRLYPDFAQELAMALGDEFEANAIYASEWADFADSCGISRVTLAQTLDKMCQGISEALPTLSALGQGLASSEWIDSLIVSIQAETERLRKQGGMIIEAE